MFRLLMLLVIIPTMLFSGTGISFGPGEIIYNNLQIGESYDFGKLSNVKFEVKNNCEKSIGIKIIKYAPSKGSVKKGYEPIPDLSWVKVYPDSHKKIRPGKKKKASIIITIPNKKKYLGKKYQVMLQARIDSKSFMGVGVNSRVLFSVNKKKIKGKTKKLIKPARFKVTPEKIHIDNLKFNSKSTYGKIKVKNLSGRKLDIEMVLLSEKQCSRKFRPGYKEFPGINQSEPTKHHFLMKPGETKEGSVRLKVGKQKKYKHNKYQLFINVRTRNEEITEEFYIPVFIEIE